MTHWIDRLFLPRLNQLWIWEHLLLTPHMINCDLKARETLPSETSINASFMHNKLILCLSTAPKL